MAQVLAPVQVRRPADVAVTAAVPSVYAERVVVMVAVDAVPPTTPVTVTRPLPLIATMPDAGAVPAQAKLASWFEICTVKPFAVGNGEPNVGTQDAAAARPV